MGGRNKEGVGNYSPILEHRTLEHRAKKKETQVLHYTELDPKEREDPMAVVFPKVEDWYDWQTSLFTIDRV